MPFCRGLPYSRRVALPGTHGFTCCRAGPLCTHVESDAPKVTESGGHGKVVENGGGCDLLSCFAKVTYTFLGYPAKEGCSPASSASLASSEASWGLSM